MPSKKANAIPRFKALCQADKKAINDCFTPYLFYEQINRQGDREFTCSHCGATYVVPATARTTTDDIWELQRVRHNEEYHCLKCRTHAIVKNKGKAKACVNLYESQRVCVIQTAGENKVFIRCFHTEKSYHSGGYNPEIKYLECGRYYLSPTEQKKYKMLWYSDGWGEFEAISEPFVIKNAMGYPCDNSYTVIGLNRLQNTFLKYNMLEEYAERRKDYLLNACRDIMRAEIKMIKYLVYFAKYPQIEMLQKLGHYDVVENLVEAGIKSGPFVNWKAKTIYEFFKMTKQEYKGFIAAGGTLRELKARQALKKAVQNPTWEVVSKYQKECEGEHQIIRAVEGMSQKGLPIKPGLDYLLKQKGKCQYYSFWETINQYDDYYRMAAALQYDLQNPIVYFPKNLREAHDNANRNHQILLEQRAAEKNRKILEEYKKIHSKYVRQYEFTNGEFSIIVPKNMDEIIREGKLQQHCVGGYAERHIKGVLTICFLRLNKDIETPLYTIEMHGDRLQQVQGKGNRTPLTKEAQTFFDSWLAWVKGGSKHYKDGSPKLPSIVKTA